MTSQEIATLKKRIIAASVYYGRQINLDVVDMYIDFLSDLSFEAIMSAIKAYCLDGRNRHMFNAAQLREIVSPVPDAESIAKEIASRITESITSFGWCNGEGARKYIGEIGWEIVRRKGGWMNICQNHGVTIDPGMFEAQTRELAKVQIACGQNPEFGLALKAASYGELKLVPQFQTLEEIEERKIKLLQQAKDIEGGK